MGNTRKPKTKFKRWDEYVTEAHIEPFQVPVDPNTTYLIEAPTGGAVIRAQELAAEGNLEEQLRVICGDSADDILPLIKSAPAGVMGAFIEDVMAHFGYDSGEASAP